MTEQINYNIIDGEPVANRDCYYHHTERCTLISKGTYLTPCIPSSHSTCIPGLRLQRDQFKKTLEELFDEIEQLKTECDEARNLVLDLYDKDPCWYDRHGYCQAHLSLDYEHPCPHGIAQEKLIDWGIIKKEECVRK